MGKRITSWAVAAASLGLVLGACGSDKKTEIDGSKAAAAVAGASKASKDAKTACQQLLESAQATALVAEDPNKAKDLSKYISQAATAGEKATAMVTKGGDDGAYMESCLTASSGIVAGTGGGATPGTAAPGETTAPADTTASAGTTGGGSNSGGTASAQEFCKKIAELADLIKAAKADPSKAGELATKVQEFTKLAQDAGAVIAEDPANAKIVEDCSNKAAAEING